MNNNTLKELILEKQCRKGPAAGIDDRGAYWLPHEGEFFSKLRFCETTAQEDRTTTTAYYLRFLHFRDGSVNAQICYELANFRFGDYCDGRMCYLNAKALLKCSTIWEVILVLQNLTDHSGQPVYDSKLEPALRAELLAFGMPDSCPGPDDP